MLTEQEQGEILEAFAGKLLEGMRESEFNLTDEQFMEAFGPLDVPETERPGAGWQAEPPTFTATLDP